MTTYLGKVVHSVNCAVSFVNVYQFAFVRVSLLVLRVGYGI